jgi:hypothetical protein
MHLQGLESAHCRSTMPQRITVTFLVPQVCGGVTIFEILRYAQNDSEKG